MNLVNSGKDDNCYINMDLITKVSYNNNDNNKGYHAYFVNGSYEDISESAYNTILLYGKAKIQ
jgi:hypothetical protein